jgi:hypothetical protein
LRQALSNQARRSPSSPLVDDEEPIGSDYRVEIDPTREIAPRRDRDSSRRMRGSISNSAETSELRGDTANSSRSRRPKRSSENNGNDSVIDIDENDIRPVTPKRRPRPSGDNINGDQPRNRNGEADNFEDGESGKSAAAGRRRRPSSRNSTSNSNDISDTEDF